MINILSKKYKLVLLGIFIFSGLFLFKADVEACQVTNINYRQNAVQNPWVDADNNNETNFEEGFIIDNEPPYFYFDIQTTNCTLNDGNPDITFEIWEEDDGIGVSPGVNVTPATIFGFVDFTDNEVYSGEFDLSDNNFTLAFTAGDFHCEPFTPTNCWYYLQITDGVDTNVRWDAPIQGPNNGSLLKYDCDDLCNDLMWVFLGQIVYGQNHENDTTNTANPITSGGGIQSTDYLAPLPGLEGQPAGLKGFLQGLFNVLIIIAGIGAILMIVIGAITYVSAGALSGKQNGRDMMLNAVLGLILALGAWVIINTINPDLAESLNITIPSVRLNVLEGDSPIYGNTPTSTSSGTITAFTLPSSPPVVCTGSGGSSAVPSIIDSFVDKVAYRWGGKGGALPSGQSFPLSPSEQDNGPFECINDSGDKVPCNTFCPEGNICLDCSGFVNHVRQCAGLPSYQTGTLGMTNHPDAEPVNMNQLNSSGTSIGNYVLVPGDLLVWNGHVVVYYGDGKIAESGGGANGRKKDANVQIHSVKKYKNKITHIIKV